MDSTRQPGGDEELEKLLPLALAITDAADEAHWGLEALAGLAAGRRAGGATWQLPVHLSRCSLCLEAFELILEGIPQPSETVLDRYRKLRPAGRVIKPERVTRLPVIFWLKIAAAIAVLGGGVFLFSNFSNRTTSGHVSQGTVALPNGDILERGAVIPGKTRLIARESTRATFGDGSNVDLTKQTEVSFQESYDGNTTVALSGGSLDASVMKQAEGRKFMVKTPLGDVTVVGTRFRVACDDEDVIVYETTARESQARERNEVVRAVRVTVFEGVVRVERRGEQVEVLPQQTAVLRQNEPRIELITEAR